MEQDKGITAAVQRLAIAIKGLTVKIEHLEKQMEKGDTDVKQRLRKLESRMWETNGQESVVSELRRLAEAATNLKDRLDEAEDERANRWKKFTDGFAAKVAWAAFMAILAVIVYAAQVYLRQGP